MRSVFGLAFACLAACSSGDVAPTGWPFDPVQFFKGHTHGEARLRLITGASHRISVDSFGILDGHGGLRLDQTIQEQGEAKRERQWIIQPAGPNRWTGTLTDATGPVTLQRTSTDIAIRYRMKSGPLVEQHLQLPPDGVAWNHMTVSRFGIELATLDERIRRIG